MKVSRKDCNRMYYAWLDSKQKGGKSLLECYRKPSYNKINAYTECLSEMAHEGGYNGTIVNYNSQMFTFAYIVWNDTTPELRYLTKEYTYIIKLDFRGLQGERFPR